MMVGRLVALLLLSASHPLEQLLAGADAAWSALPWYPFDRPAADQAGSCPIGQWKSTNTGLMTRSIGAKHNT